MATQPTAASKDAIKKLLLRKKNAIKYAEPVNLDMMDTQPPMTPYDDSMRDAQMPPASMPAPMRGGQPTRPPVAPCDDATLSAFTHAFREVCPVPHPQAPALFDGVSHDIVDWLSDFDIHASLLHVTDDADRLHLLITHLTGEAKQW